MVYRYSETDRRWAAKRRLVRAASTQGFRNSSPAPLIAGPAANSGLCRQTQSTRWLPDEVTNYSFSYLETSTGLSSACALAPLRETSRGSTRISRKDAKSQRRWKETKSIQVPAATGWHPTLSKAQPRRPRADCRARASFLPELCSRSDPRVADASPSASHRWQQYA